MKTLLLLFLIALAAHTFTGSPAQEPEHEGLTCLLVQQHVNAVYESAYRGESYLTREAVRVLWALECEACDAQSHTCRLLAGEGVTPAP